MKEFLETTAGRILLAVVVLVIWGKNAINISELGSGNDQVSVQDVQRIDVNDLVVPTKIQYEYTAVGRDPFKSPAFREGPQITIQEEQEEEVVLPPITLSGIMEGMAVVTDQQGNTHLLKRNDMFMNDIYVMHIWADSVLLEFKDKKFTLKLN